MAVDADATGELTAEPEEDADDLEAVARPISSTSRRSLSLVLAVLVALGTLFGWLGYRTYQTRQDQSQSDLFLQVGRQAAINLTTIGSEHADADVARILDSATGTFHDDWAQRAPAFADVVKKAQSKSEGTVTAAGLESEGPDRARVLVAVSVTTSSVGAPEQQPRAWRMRIDVQKVGNDVKVSNVEFVP